QCLKKICETVFHKSYFSLEETGLAYPTVPLARVRDADDQNVFAAYLRVLGDSYRLIETPYDEPRAWTSFADVKQSDRLYKFIAASGGSQSQIEAELQRALDVLGQIGHHNGIIHASWVRIQTVSPNDPCWRCDNCGRVHVHRGTGICTR